MQFTNLNYDQAHRVVSRNRFLRWDGWDITTWRADAAGFMDTRGKFMPGKNGKAGRWGIEFRYPVRADGTWSIPTNYVDHS